MSVDQADNHTIHYCAKQQTNSLPCRGCRSQLLSKTKTKKFSAELVLSPSNPRVIRQPVLMLWQQG